MKGRVLIVEDNVDLAEGVADTLRYEGYDVRIEEEGGGGLAAAREWPADLMILDLMLPGLDGYAVLKALRADGMRTPVIILSARGEEADKIKGFRLDADQYVTKPFGVYELVERVGALLRRSRPGRADVAVRFGAIVVNESARTVHRNGAPISLSPKEFTLLLALIRRQGAVATRVDLLHEVWGYRDSVMSRTVDSHVAALRRKLEEDPADPRHIVTVWTVGYRFSA